MREFAPTRPASPAPAASPGPAAAKEKKKRAPRGAPDDNYQAAGSGQAPAHLDASRWDGEGG
eukprot:922434-Pleurochrysis_carterae.AAC.1